MRKHERVTFDDMLDAGATCQFPKPCGCGRTHTASSWPLLALVGVMGDAQGVIELRNCTCGSTIAVEVDVDEVIATHLGGEVFS